MSYDPELHKAVMLTSTGKHKQALRIITDMLARDPRDPMALGMKATILLNTGRQAEAYKAASAACAADPENPLVLLTRAYALLALQQYELAGADVQRALALAPELPQGWALRTLVTGMTVEQQGFATPEQRQQTKDDAEQFLRRGGVEEPGSALAATLGLAAVKESGRAKELCAEALRLHPDDSGLQAVLGLLRSGAPLDVQAFPLFEQAARGDASVMEFATFGMESTWARRITRVQGGLLWAAGFSALAVAAEHVHGWSQLPRAVVAGLQVLAALLTLLTGLRMPRTVREHVRELPGTRPAVLLTVCALAAGAVAAAAPVPLALAAVGVTVVSVALALPPTCRAASEVLRHTEATIQPLMRIWVKQLLSAGLVSSCAAVPILLTLLVDRWAGLRLFLAAVLGGAGVAQAAATYPVRRWQVTEALAARTGHSGPTCTALLILLPIAAAWAPRWWGVALIALMVPVGYRWNNQMRMMIAYSDPSWNRVYAPPRLL
ncbi:tetratricopeptide repeat protein [Streptomyces griseiscabiei]|uniref:Tetratricopeptide repeat protein n=1 Tax=Streptomyces griseiscabiei TaxID=2993540 RepID=A0ABU4LA22_9ACTN|nr:hypothetical protein [Streptomyces griseiscabiei]MBZ3903723.1 hypothetical protein [Streptomyces griseiscabiei]MDX2912468.1 hypothetical protein [Streptomyces griseiscabiei]